MGPPIFDFCTQTFRADNRLLAASHTSPPNHISVPLPLYLYVHTVAHPCDILPLTQVHPKMLCIYTSLVDLTETWHIWLKGTQSNKVVCMKHHFYPTQTVTFLFSAIPILLPQKQKSFHSGSYPLVTMETRTSFYPPFRLLPTCYHGNKNIILSSIQALTHLLPQKQEHHSYPLLGLLSTCYHRNKIIPTATGLCKEICSRACSRAPFSDC